MAPFLKIIIWSWHIEALTLSQSKGPEKVNSKETVFFIVIVIRLISKGPQPSNFPGEAITSKLMERLGRKPCTYLGKQIVCVANGLYVQLL